MRALRCTCCALQAMRLLWMAIDRFVFIGAPHGWLKDKRDDSQHRRLTSGSQHRASTSSMNCQNHAAVRALCHCTTQVMRWYSHTQLVDLSKVHPPDRRLSGTVFFEGNRVIDTPCSMTERGAAGHGVPGPSQSGPHRPPAAAAGHGDHCRGKYLDLLLAAAEEPFGTATAMTRVIITKYLRS